MTEDLKDIDKQFEKIQTEILTLTPNESDNTDTGGGGNGGKGGFSPDEREKRKNEKLKNEKEELKRFYAELERLTNEQYMRGVLSEQEHKDTLRLIDISANKEMIELLKKHGEDYTSELEKQGDLELAEFERRKSNDKYIKDARLSLPKAIKEETPNELSMDATTWYIVEIDKIEQLRKKDLISEQQYLEQKKELHQRYIEAKMQKEHDSAEVAAEIAGQALQLVQTAQNVELAAIDRKFAGKMKAAKGNAAEEARLQEEIEEEKKAVKKKYADIEFAMIAAQIISQTALGIMNIWAKFGHKPPVAIALSTLLGLTSAAQLALANEQRMAVKELYSGGFTEDGAWDQPRGIVHAGEFVANRHAVNNPTLKRMFLAIDNAQKTNTVSSLNEQSLSNVMGFKVKAMAANQISPGISSKMQEEQEKIIVTHDKSQILILTKIIKLLEKGTIAKVILHGDDGLETQHERYNRLRHRNN